MLDRKETHLFFDYPSKMATISCLEKSDHIVYGPVEWISVRVEIIILG